MKVKIYNIKDPNKKSLFHLLNENCFLETYGSNSREHCRDDSQFEGNNHNYNN